ncbi:MAG: OprO/OprP family phosphate-selective porin [Candidatus Cryptobacteroides sp.]
MKRFLITLSALCIASLAFAQQEEEQYNQYGVKVSAEPLLVESQDGFFVARSPESKYKLWFDCRVQADAAAYFMSDEVAAYAPNLGNGASIRRARFAVKAQLDENWYGEIDMDMADGIFELKDAIIRYTGLPNTEITIGNFKEFFSIQRNNSSRYLQFMERPMAAQAFGPSRHIGINVKWAKDWLWLTGGIFGQTIDNVETATYVQDRNKALGTDQGLSFTGKVVYMPGWNKEDWGMHIGAAVSYRQPKTDVDYVEHEVDPTENYFGCTRISTRNATSINRKKFLDTSWIPGVHHDLIYTFEYAGYWKGLRYEAAFLGDNTYIRKDYAGNQNTKMFWGAYVQAGYLLFGGQQRYDHNGAKFTRVKRGKSWGDIELCGRVEYLTLNSQDVYGGSGLGYALGLNYYITNNVKIQLNYQYNDNDLYANMKGKVNVGLDKFGNPTKVAAKVESGRGVDYHTVQMRFEINF